MVKNNRLAQQHGEMTQETVRNIPGSDGTDADIHVDIRKWTIIVTLNSCRFIITRVMVTYKVNHQLWIPGRTIENENS